MGFDFGLGFLDSNGFPNSFFLNNWSFNSAKWDLVGLKQPTGGQRLWVGLCPAIRRYSQNRQL